MTLHQLSHYGYDSADDPCLMQTFEFSSLKVCQVGATHSFSCGNSQGCLIDDAPNYFFPYGIFKDISILLKLLEFRSIVFFKALSDSGSKLRRVLLANHVDLLSEEWISKYKELGVYGVGINKKFIVVKNPNGHINYTNTELMDRVIMKYRDAHMFLPWVPRIGPE